MIYATQQMDKEKLKQKGKVLRVKGVYASLSLLRLSRGTQREYSSKPLKHSIVKRILVFKR